MGGVGTKFEDIPEVHSTNYNRYSLEYNINYIIAWSSGLFAAPPMEGKKFFLFLRLFKSSNRTPFPSALNYLFIFFHFKINFFSRY